MDERNQTTILLADEFSLVREGLAMLCEQAVRTGSARNAAME